LKETKEERKNLNGRLKNLEKDTSIKYDAASKLFILFCIFLITKFI